MSEREQESPQKSPANVIKDEILAMDEAVSRKELGSEVAEIEEDELLATAVESLDKCQLEELILKVARVALTTNKTGKFSDLLGRIIRKGEELRTSAEK